MNPEQKQHNPEMRAVQDAMTMLGRAARERDVQPDNKGVYEFMIGPIHIKLLGEADKGPHADTEPWIASVNGQFSGESHKIVRVTKNGLVGQDVGFEEDGNASPLSTEQSLKFIGRTITYEDQLAA